ncbi:MAG: nicotinamide-nucleotide amidohydrolase family protein [Sphingomonadales bacterium]|nr:nicotinamide-nucleotide amidohydrolase family protein [Sphingomonadales bacterium]
MTGFSAEAQTQGERLLDLCRKRKLTIATAESCTGGLLAALLTEFAGSSDVLDRGYVTYSNAAKMQAIGVREATIEEFGAVSAEVAEQMATGALEKAKVDLAVSITGIAGPGGGTPEKPVGLVYLCAASRDGRVVAQTLSLGPRSRSEIRHDSVLAALDLLLRLASSDGSPH